MAMKLNVERLGGWLPGCLAALLCPVITGSSRIPPPCRIPTARALGISKAAVKGEGAVDVLEKNAADKREQGAFVLSLRNAASDTS